MSSVLTLERPKAATATDVCRHCGDPCNGRPVRREGEVFCCEGCATVFALLHESGLEGFYACDVAPGVSQRKKTVARDASRFAVLDDPAVTARFVQFDDGALTAARFSVPDLHCASCLWLLERLWRLDRGIVRADADLLRRTVDVWFRPARISLRGVAEKLAAAGYEPLLTDEDRPDRMPDARRRLYLQLAVAGFAFGNIMLFSIPRYANGVPVEGGFQRLFDTLNIALALPVLLFSASGYFASAFRAVKSRQIILDVPVALGLGVLFTRSVFDIATARSEGFMDSFTGLVFFLLIGRLFQQKAFDRIAFDRSFRSFLPLSVLVERDHGRRRVTTRLSDLQVGDRIVIRPHEIVPADARLLDDVGAVDYAFVTGESSPVRVRAGDTVRAGGRASGHALRLLVLEEVSHSQLATLWNNPAFSKTKTRWLTDVSAMFGAWFTAVAIALAAVGAFAWWPNAAMSAQVATAVLIIACPCALTLAAPITLGTAMDALGRRGLYLKHAAVALDLARADTVAFDKTGTLTSAIDGTTAEPDGLTDDEWRMVRRLAAESVHPVSRAITASAATSITPAYGDVDICLESPGQGLRGLVDGHDVAIGSPAFATREQGIAVPENAEGTAVTIDGQFRGWIRLRSAVRPGVTHAIEELAHTHDVRLVSGDHADEASRWQPIFHERMSFGQSPEDKLAAVCAQQADGHHVLMIGDGLNDAGALAAADIGMAVSDETACVVPACDAVIRGDRLQQLPGFLRYARRARQVIVFCFAVSIFYNAIGLSLALAGLLTPLATAVLMPVSSLTIIGLSVGGARWFAGDLALEPGAKP
jgi:Cu+-exporting ATPase